MLVISLIFLCILWPLKSMEMAVDQNKEDEQSSSLLDLPSELQCKVVQHVAWVTQSEMVSWHAHNWQSYLLKALEDQSNDIAQARDYCSFSLAHRLGFLRPPSYSELNDLQRKNSESKKNVQSSEWLNEKKIEIASSIEGLDCARRASAACCERSIKSLLATSKTIRTIFARDVHGVKLLLFRAAEIYNYSCTDFFARFKDPLVTQFKTTNEGVCQAIATTGIDQAVVVNWFADPYFIPVWQDKMKNTTYLDRLIQANNEQALKAFLKKNNETSYCKLTLTQEEWQELLEWCAMSSCCFTQDFCTMVSVGEVFEVVLSNIINPNFSISTYKTPLQFILNKEFWHGQVLGNPKNNTYLQYILGEQRLLVKKLIQYGVDPLIPNYRGLTAAEHIASVYIDELADHGKALLDIVQKHDAV